MSVRSRMSLSESPTARSSPRSLSVIATGALVSFSACRTMLLSRGSSASSPSAFASIVKVSSSSMKCFSASTWWLTQYSQSLFADTTTAIDSRSARLRPDLPNISVMYKSR